MNTTKFEENIMRLVLYVLSFMGGHKNSFFHLKLIEKMSFYLNFRAHKGSVPKTGTVFGTALMIIFCIASDIHADDNTHQDKISYILATTLETQIILTRTYKIPFMTGESPLTSGNNLSCELRGELSPVSLSAGFETVITPIAFMEFTFGGIAGSGWNIPFAHGLSKNERKGTHDNKLTERAFIGMIHKEYAGSALQIDTGEIFPGRWTHVLMRTYHEAYYKGLTSADGDESWLWQNDEGDNRNGWHYYSQYVLGYKLPYAFEMIAFMFEAERPFYKVPTWSKCGENNWRYTASCIVSYRFTEKTALVLLTQIRTVPNYTAETEDYGFYRDRVIDGKKPRKWGFYRVVANLSHNF
jgi:hypothetical protein